MIKNDLGFIVPTLTNDQQSQGICSLINYLVYKHPKIQFCIFNQYCDLLDTKNVPLVPISYARYFKGDLLIMDFSSLVMSVNFPATENIYYFTNIAPWMSQHSEYRSWKNIFGKQNLNIFSTEKSICDIYNILWNINTTIVKEINYDTILSIIR